MAVVRVAVGPPRGIWGRRMTPKARLALEDEAVVTQRRAVPRADRAHVREHDLLEEREVGGEDAFPYVRRPRRPLPPPRRAGTAPRLPRFVKNMVQRDYCSVYVFVYSFRRLVQNLVEKVEFRV